MAFVEIDPTTPAGTEKKKFGDDRIREFKEQAISNFEELSNYPASTKPALRLAVWTTATRPTGDELVDRVTGYNTDLGCDEYYDLASTSWKQKRILPAWNVASRPSSPYVGQYGHNTDLAVIERWSGSAWVRVSGGDRGDICMWTGAIADIPTKKPGWVLSDGVTRTHPEGGTYTPPNLVDRFIVGAGYSYGVGYTGGEATHVLTVNEIPPHSHSVTVTTSGTSDVNPFNSIRRTSGNDGATNAAGRIDIGYTGNGWEHENRPPYYALCYLYKL